MIELSHKFVEFIPKELEENVLYISLRFRTAIHNCVCGCGNKAVTPLSPTDWKLIYNGSSVSLEPSIGNWNFPCQSHYWITEGKIDWDVWWTKNRIARGRELSKIKKEEYYALGSKSKKPVPKTLIFILEKWYKLKKLFTIFRE